VYKIKNGADDEPERRHAGGDGGAAGHHVVCRKVEGCDDDPKRDRLGERLAHPEPLEDSERLVIRRPGRGGGCLDRRVGKVAGTRLDLPAKLR
jgi:hypothetical protein